VVKATVNTYHTMDYKRLAGLQTPTKHSRDDTQAKKEAEFPRLTDFLKMLTYVFCMTNATAIEINLKLLLFI
jgi:hypothetical protein